MGKGHEIGVVDGSLNESLYQGFKARLGFIRRGGTGDQIKVQTMSNNAAILLGGK